METLVLRIVLPPVTVLLAGWVQHRLGPRLSGRLVGLPLTSGPFLLVLLLQHGAEAAVAAARGVVAGQLMVVAFATTYAGLAGRRAAVPLAGAVSATLAAGLLAQAALPWPAAPVVAPAAAVLALLAWPRGRRPLRQATDAAGPGAVELAGRAALTGGLVATLTAAAPVLGAGPAGLLASVPLVVAVLAPTTRRRSGPDATRELLRGTITAVPGTAAFATVLAVALADHGPGVAFGAALLALALGGRAVGARERRRAEIGEGPS